MLRDFAGSCLQGTVLDVTLDAHEGDPVWTGNSTEAHFSQPRTPATTAHIVASQFTDRSSRQNLRQNLAREPAAKFSPATVPANPPSLPPSKFVANWAAHNHVKQTIAGRALSDENAATS
jgi:hypothetical protein